MQASVIILPIEGKKVPVLSINGLRAHAVRTGCYADSNIVVRATLLDLTKQNKRTNRRLGPPRAGYARGYAAPQDFRFFFALQNVYSAGLGK